MPARPFITTAHGDESITGKSAFKRYLLQRPDRRDGFETVETWINLAAGQDCKTTIKLSKLENSVINGLKMQL